MTIIDKPLAKGQYVEEVLPKDLLLLHFTAGGSADGAFQSWAASPERVATAYILDLDGTVYRTFDPKLWAFHLGQKGTNANDRRSVAIEIVNVGPLVKRDNNLCWWPEDFSQVYCEVGYTSKYVQPATPYRGYDYYAAFTDAQKVVIPQLVKQVCTDHSIPLTLPPAIARTVCDQAFFRNFKGIASHQNFRSDKFDVGPAFPWDLLESICPVSVGP